MDESSQTFERWTADDTRPDIVAEELRWAPPGAAAPFTLDVVSFFADLARRAQSLLESHAGSAN